MKKSGILYIFLLLGISCTKTLPPSLEHLAELECRAVTLKDQRFELANELRNAEDSMIHHAAIIDTNFTAARIREMQDQKIVLRDQSLALADSIKNHIDSLFTHSYKTPEEKEQFAKDLKELMKKKGCNPI